ncbi:MAG: hypothetical protein Q4B62_05185 [Clostridiaceae bacterium]|nr:hypothetical protein [Clostridiaceae bacterium]
MKLLKKITAVFTAAAMLLIFASCGKEKEETTTSPTSAEVTTAAETSAAETTEADTTAETTAAEETTAEPTTAEETTSEPTTKAPETTTQKATSAPTTVKPTSKPATTVKKATTTQKTVSAPTSKADILKLYNDATAKAAKSKPGYSKTRSTVLSNLEMGALSKLDVVRTAIGDFLGEGTSSEKVSKGKFDGKSLVKSSLTASDVTSADCTLSSDKKYYTVTLTVKNETNPIKGKSSLSKFTNDFKDNNEIKAGLDEAGASVGTLNINTRDVKIVAKISVDGNRLVSLTHSFKMKADLKKVKYTIVSVNEASALLETKVTYSDFKY